MSKKIDVKPYNIGDLADIYGVCNKTFKKWIQPFEKEIGKKHGRFFSIAQVKIIFEILGMPENNS